MATNRHFSIPFKKTDGTKAEGLIDASRRVVVVDQVANSLVPSTFDYIGVTYPNDTTEIYVFKTGGASGTIVSTITVVYTTNTKEFISTVTKT
jgi:hypothetical protein